MLRFVWSGGGLGDKNLPGPASPWNFRLWSKWSKWSGYF